MLAVIAGSGIADAIPADVITRRRPMAEVVGGSAPSVAGHGSDIVEISVEGRRATIALGRVHLYEGASPADVCAMVDHLANEGCTHLLLTNAAGGLHPLLRVGDLVVASDLLNATYHQPPSHPDVRDTEVLDRAWSDRLAAEARDRGVATRRGTYVSVLGPSYETRAEIGMYRTMGADVIGMSTVLEARHARTRGLCVAVASVVTNVLSNVQTPALDHAHVIAAGRDRSAHLWTLIKSAIFTA